MRNKHFRRIVCIVLVALLCFSFTACGKTECQHEWYLSNHVAATATTNGSNQYTCKKCGQTYSEVIPATGGGQTQPSQGGQAQPSQSTAAPKREYTLFDLKEYDKARYAASYVDYKTEVIDSAGNLHKNVYAVTGHATYLEELYYRYGLNGEYTRISGQLFAEQDREREITGWLEFYEGDRLLYRTERVSSTASESVSFSFDVTGVNNLTVFFRADGFMGVCYMILDPITISN